MRKQIIILSAILVVLLGSCSVGKRLDTTTYLLIDESNYMASFDAKSRKYLDVNSKIAYRDEFTQELENSLSSYNIKVVNSKNTNVSSSLVYSLKLKQFEFLEDFVTESVYMDSLSTNPEYFDVVSCSVESNCELFKIGSVGRENLMKSYQKSVSKSEKLTNSRTFWQIVFGTNKDNSQYTYKELSSDVFVDLCRKSARRTAASISRTLYKKQ